MPLYSSNKILEDEFVTLVIESFDFPSYYIFCNIK